MENEIHLALRLAIQVEWNKNGAIDGHAPHGHEFANTNTSRIASAYV